MSSQPAETTPSPATPEKAPRASANNTSLFGYGGFNKLFWGSLSGKLADRLYQMAMVSAAFVVFAGAAPDNQLAKIQIVATAPLFLLYWVIGTLIDVVDRRRLMYGLMAAKFFVVLAFVPLLWPITTNTSAETIEFIRHNWFYGLATIFALGLLDAPFGPARAAAVPDVAPREHYRLGASLMASSGLIAILVGSLLGLQLARTCYLGPGKTILLAAGCYAISSLLLLWLPNAVAVPGCARATAGPAPVRLTVAGYVRDQWEGAVYSWRTFGIPELIAFETMFWCLASAFYLLFTWYLDSRLHLRPDDKSQTLSFVLGAAGVGLFAGATLAGKLSRRVTPILTYPPALLIMAIGALFAFQVAAIDVHTPGDTAQFEQGDWVEMRPALTAGAGALAWGRVDALAPDAITRDSVRIRVDARKESMAVPRSEVILVVGTAPTRLLAYLCLAGLILGLGGGLLLGRVDADVLSVADERLRGRVFSIKAIAFTLALIGTMYGLTQSTEAFKSVLASWFAAGLAILAVPALLFSWRLDIAIWAPKAEPELSGPVHRAAYRLARDTFKLICRVLFRYEVIGAEKIPAQGAVVLAANHASFIDPILLGCATDRIVQYIMGSTYYQSFAHPLFRLVRCIPVDEKGPLAALKAGARSLERGACVGIFPEGRVSSDGRLQPAQSGALFLAQHAGATVVPVALKGDHQALPRGAWWPRCSKITVIVGEPFTVPKTIPRPELDGLTQKLMAQLGKMLA